MDKNIKISVIIPAYNAEKTIVQCLESVLNQTSSIHEIIVIDDGSTDNTMSVLNRFIDKHTSQNIILLSQTNNGPSKARNNGIKNSTGDWIAFLDADDIWLPNKIEKQLEFLKLNPDCKMLGTQLFHNTGCEGMGYRFITFRSMLFKNSFYTSSVLIQKKVIVQFYFDSNQRYAEDYKLWLQITKYYISAVLLTELVVYADNQKFFNRRSLSGRLWNMEKAVQSNFIFLYKQKELDIFTLFLTLLFSDLKFVRRLFLKIFQH